MNDRYRQIDKFLKIWRDVAKENPSVTFDDVSGNNMIYRYLIRLNISNEEQALAIDNSHFPAWISRFEENENIDCFVSENWKYFCQFVNGKIKQNEYIKVYVPLDSQHIWDGVNIIFDFLSQNNIIHQSKVGKRFRFDNVVIRLTNKKDAEKLIKFIKTNQYIQDGLVEPNPFAYNKDNIALACDGNISYNETVSSCIGIYISEKRKNNQLDEVGVKDFYVFLSNYYYNVFMNKDYNKFKEDFNLEDFNGLNDNVFANYKQVLALIIKSADPNFNFDNYIDHFKMCAKGKVDENYLQSLDFIPPTIKDNGITPIEELLFEVLDTMTRKYGRDYAIKNISSYLKTGMSNYITRDNNLRERVITSNFFEYINNNLSKNNLSLEQYINLLENKGKRTSDKEQILISSLMSTYNKYEKFIHAGKQYVLSALISLTTKNSYLGFTRENGARDLMVNNVTQNDVINIFKQKYGYADLDATMLTYVCNMYTENLINMQKKMS